MRKITFALVLFASANLLGQEFSLFQAQEYALNNRETIENARLDLESAEKQVVETRAIGLPQISSEMNFQNFLNIPVQVIDASAFNPQAQEGELSSFRFGTDYNVNAGVTLNQLIFDGSYIVGLQVSKFYTDFVESSIKKSQQDVLAEVTKSYEMAMISKQNKEFVDTLVNLSEDLLNKQRELYDLGLITQEQLDQTEYSLLQAKANKLASNVAYENALTMLKMTMAYPMGEPIRLTEDLDALMSEQMKDLTGSIENNLQLEILSKQTELSRYDLKNTKMANLPRLAAFANHQYNAFSNEFTFFESSQEYFSQTVWGLRLSIPIFSSGERWAKTQKAQIAVKQNELSIQELERGLYAQEIQIKNNLRQARSNLTLKEKNIELARKIYNNSLTKAQLGRENSILVTQKYNQLIAAQTEYVNAMLDVLNTKVQLDELYNKLIRE
jgi:outer membrane protein TolC